MDKVPYEFACVRYIPDVVTGEFLNIGVVLFSPTNNFVIGQFQSDTERVSKIFPESNLILYRGMVEFLEEAVNTAPEGSTDGRLVGESISLRSAMETILVPDDSSYQLGPIGIGVTDDPVRELGNLYCRMVESRSENVDPKQTVERKAYAELKSNIVEGVPR